MKVFIQIQILLDSIVKNFQPLSSLAIRLYLAPVFFFAGLNKFKSFDSTVEWFANKDWGLGLPFPEVMAFLATSAELGGSILLILGLGTRYISIPLIITMLVAAFSVHVINGWQAITDNMSPWASENSIMVTERLIQLKEFLKSTGSYDYYTEFGSIVISNNGVEWSITYLIMLLALFFLGGGRYVSLDYWIRKRFMR